MPGEYGHSPEQMAAIEKSRTISDLIKEGGEYETDRQGNEQMVNPDPESKLVVDAAQAVNEAADQDSTSDFSRYALSPAEQEDIRTDIERQLTLFLGDLYDLLPHDSQSKVDAKEVIELIPLTRLNTAIPLPFWRKLLAAAIERNGLTHKSKAEFISSGLAALDAMTGMQAIVEAGDRQLDESIAAKRKTN